MRTIQIPASIRPSGVAYAEIVFTLVDGAGLPIVAVDVPSSGPITVAKTAQVADSPVEVELTPQDEIYRELSLPSWYRIDITIGTAVTTHLRQIADSASPLAWVDLIGNGGDVSPAALDVWITHPADDDRHLLAAERAALSAANAPGAGNAIATIADITGGGGFVPPPSDGKFYAYKDGAWVDITNNLIDA